MTNIEGKHLKLMKELEILEEKMQELKRTFKRIKGKYVTEGRKRKESRRKANSRKRKRFKENLTRVYDILPGCLLYPSSIFVPEMCVDVENVSALLLHRDAPYIAHLIQENDFTNAGASRLLTNLQPQVRDRVYCYLYISSRILHGYGRGDG